ncbi:MAG TPA: c-type cytochrome [Chthonomonadaceae bacterium]|nr:c-type cytochrome [Chthonomonadaceae bacterium]
MQPSKSSSNRFPKRWLLGSLLAPLALLTLASGLPTHGAPQHKKPPTAPQRFKNIKVLKNLPADQLIPVMEKINASLGVRCDFCHVINPNHTGFERDDKPTKGIARQMIVMTQSLNAHYQILGKQASCYMCHHGHPQPEINPPQQMMPPPGGRGTPQR